jgi:hypothetical protein
MCVLGAFAALVDLGSLRTLGAFAGAIIVSGGVALHLLGPHLEMSSRRGAAWSHAFLLSAATLLLGLPIEQLVAAPTVREAVSSARLPTSLAIAAAGLVSTLPVVRAWRRVAPDDWKRIAIAGLILAAPLALDQRWLFLVLAVGAAQGSAFLVVLRDAASARPHRPAAAALLAFSLTLALLFLVGRAFGPTLGPFDGFALRSVPAFAAVVLLLGPALALR